MRGWLTLRYPVSLALRSSLFKAGGDWLLAYALQQTGHLQQQVSLTENNEYHLRIRKARRRGGYEDRLIKKLSDAIKDPNSFRLLVVLSLGLTLSSGWYRRSECHSKIPRHQKEEKECLFCGFLRSKDNFLRRLYLMSYWPKLGHMLFAKP